jgi:hypothetical protein
MIESRYWRAELRRDLAWLRAHQRYRRWTEKQQVLFERRLMLVAFQIRVLLDRPKVSARVRRTTISTRMYRKVGSEPVTILNSVALDEHFDLDNPEIAELPIRDLCNQLVHHYVLFALRGERTSFEVVMVCSDYKRNTCLYELAVPDVLKAFAVFASEDSAPHNDVEIRFRWDDRRQDYVWEVAPELTIDPRAP